MISKQTADLLLANRKTKRDFLGLVSSSPFSLRDIEWAFLEVREYEDLEIAIDTASELNMPLVETARGIRLGRIARKAMEGQL